MRVSRRPLRVAVAGLGRHGVAHTAVLAHLPGAQLVAVVDPRSAARAALRGMGFDVPAFARIERLLEKEPPDAVVVCAAPQARAAVAEAVLRAGLPALVEPPVGRTLEEAAALVALAAQRGVPLAVGHAQIFEPVFAYAVQALRDGAPGRLRQVRSSMYVSRVFGRHPRGGSLDPRRAVGGVVAQLSHDLLFMLVWALGPPVQVRATAHHLYGTLEDELQAMMTLADGTEVGFDSSWSVPGYPRASTVIEAEGENGKLLVSEEALELELRRPVGNYPAGLTHLRDSELPRPARLDLAGEALWLQDAAFLDWVAGGPAPPNDAQAALATQRVMDALYRSSAADGAPLEVTR